MNASLETEIERLSVSLLVYQHVLATSLTLPLEMLLAGEAFARRYDKSAIQLNTQLLGQYADKIKSRAGINIVPDSYLVASSGKENTAYQQAPDIIIVPSMWRNPRPILKQHALLISWLKKCWQQGSTLIGVGTGVCFLAESGLLDDHPATTHWHYVDQFKRDYPKVDLKPDFFYYSI